MVVSHSHVLMAIVCGPKRFRQLGHLSRLLIELVSVGPWR